MSTTCHFISSLVCNEYPNSNFSICISDDNNVYSWGYNQFGSHGHEATISIPKQIENLSNIYMISAGLNHTVCLDNEGTVFSFGHNLYGQLGIGKDTKVARIPEKVNLPSIIQISCCGNSTMCLTEDNTLYSFGDNKVGQLGLGNNDIYEYPQLIPDFNNIEFISCGTHHVICKTYNNVCYSWGNNSYGELGQDNYTSCNKPIQCKNWPDDIKSIKCSFNFSFILTGDGKVYSFGTNGNGQIGLTDTTIKKVNIPTLIDIPQIQRLECGLFHTICIDYENNLWAFGDNSKGQLAISGKMRVKKPTKHSELSNIIDISSGGGHTFVKTAENKIFAFGNNDRSQLGIQTPLNKLQYTPIQVFKGMADIWSSQNRNNRAKSARK